MLIKSLVDAISIALPVLSLVPLVSCLTDLSKYGEAIPLIDASAACDGKTSLEVHQELGYIRQKDYDETGLHAYPDGLRCSWTLVAPEGFVFWIKTVDMDMETDCRGFVELVDGVSGRSLTKFCGRRVRSFRSPGNVLKINFVGRPDSSGGVPQARGAMIYFQRTRPPVECDEDQMRCRNRLRCFSKKETCDGHDQCGDGTDEEGCPPSNKQLSFQEDCGQPAIEPRVSRLRFKIVGGTAARPGSWPWQVSMRLVAQEPQGHLCGATIIDGQWLLTAAHCFYEYYQTRDWTLHFAKFNKIVKDPNEVVRYIDKLIIHPDFKGGYEADDIALIKLNAYLPSDNEGIATLCFPDGNEDEPGSMAFITGWGETMNTGFSVVLKQTQLPIISRDQCQDWLKGFDISDRMICAGFEHGGHDTCQGDSGGPFFVKNEETGRWTLLGVTSTGGRCCGMCERSPGVYSRVSSYLGWIKKVMADDL